MGTGTKEGKGSIGSVRNSLHVNRAAVPIQNDWDFTYQRPAKIICLSFVIGKLLK